MGKTPIVKDQVDRDVLDGVSEQGLGVSQLVHPLGARAQLRPLFKPSAALDVSPSFGSRVAQKQRHPAGLDRKSGDAEVLVEIGDMGLETDRPAATRHCDQAIELDSRQQCLGQSAPISSTRFVPNRLS